MALAGGFGTNHLTTRLALILPIPFAVIAVVLITNYTAGVVTNMDNWEQEIQSELYHQDLLLDVANVRYYSTGYVMGAIKNDNTGWVWGYPLNSIPTKVIDNVKFLDAGRNCCTFVKNDGTVWSVGSNSTGVFGNGFIGGSPTTIPSKMLDVNTAVRVANGFYNNIVLLDNGTVLATGEDFYFGFRKW